MRVGKILLNKDIVRIMATSIKGRHSINAEINVELLFEYVFFFPQWTETVFITQFLKVEHYDTSIPY